MAIRVLVDACLLVKGNVSNVLFDLAAVGLIHLHWSEGIEQQFVKNWAEVRLSKEAAAARSRHEPLSAAQKQLLLQDFIDKARTRAQKFGLMQPEWRIPGWPGEPQAFQQMAQEARTLCQVHPGDLGIALAAVALRRAFPDDEVWLATENIQDLCPSQLGAHGVWCLDQGQLLEELWVANESAVVTAIERFLSDTRKPKLTQTDALEIVDSVDGFASPKIAEAVAKAWGLRS